MGVSSFSMIYDGCSIRNLIVHTRSNKDVGKWIVHAIGDQGIGKWVVCRRNVNVSVN